MPGEITSKLLHRLLETEKEFVSDVLKKTKP
jgi:hypothetical protein